MKETLMMLMRSNLISSLNLTSVRLHIHLSTPAHRLRSVPLMEANIMPSTRVRYVLYAGSVRSGRTEVD